jgi:hypothetical protein
MGRSLPARDRPTRSGDAARQHLALDKRKQTRSWLSERGTDWLFTLQKLAARLSLRSEPRTSSRPSVSSRSDGSGPICRFLRERTGPGSPCARRRMPSVKSGEREGRRPSQRGMQMDRTQMICSTSCCCPSDRRQAQALRRRRFSSCRHGHLKGTAARRAARDTSAPRSSTSAWPSTASRRWREVVSGCRIASS